MRSYVDIDVDIDTEISFSWVSSLTEIEDRTWFFADTFLSLFNSIGLISR